MIRFGLSTTLLLAAVCALIAAVACQETVVTCGTSGNVHRLSCDYGVIRVQSVLYGRQDATTCSAGISASQLTNTRCSLAGALNTIRDRCDGRTQCEVNIRSFSADPCPGIFKYVQTRFTCFPALRTTTCEGSDAFLHCGRGQVIFVYGAYYGRTDQTTCSFRRSTSQLRNVRCARTVTSRVSTSCNGRNSCTISVKNTTPGFGDPCRGTYKYMEASYICEFPLL